ncbi:MAG: flagellar biosynthesis anti-sigma factor FlgM [Mariniblastus sp.]|nr:flagellar biosynthesis anti-sigma factor FlgM [Mariniblastus sp.]
MQIRPTSSAQTSAVNLQTQANQPTTESSNSAPVDQLDISPEAQLMSTQATGQDIRADRVSDIRAQIADGQYETPEKLELAFNRMFDEIA